MSSFDIPSDAEPPDLTPWCRELLGLSREGNEDEVFPRLLKRLQSEDFVPSSLEDSAIRLLQKELELSGGLPAERELRELHRAELSQRTEWFADRFFRMETAEREQAWWDLYHECGNNPLLRLRLERMRPGLRAEPGQQQLELLAPDAIGDLFQRLFTASFSERNEILTDLHQQTFLELDSLAEAASRLEMHHPAIAALEPALLKELLQHKELHEQRAVNRIKRRKAVESARRKQEVKRPIEGALAGVVLGIIALIAYLGFGGGNRSQTQRDADTTARFMMSALLQRIESEAQLTDAEQLARQHPDNAAHRYRFAQQLIEAASAPPSSEQESTRRFLSRTASERGDLYAQACSILQELVAEDPSNHRFASTFVKAVSAYDDMHRKEAVAPSQRVSPPSADTAQEASQKALDEEGGPSFLVIHFETLAAIYLAGDRPGEALATFRACRSAVNKPQILFRLAVRLAQAGWRLRWRAPNDAAPEQPAAAGDMQARFFLEALLTLVQAATAWADAFAEVGAEDSLPHNRPAVLFGREPDLAFLLGADARGNQR